MNQLKTFAGFPPCPDDAFVSSLTFQIIIYILIILIMYLIVKNTIARKNKVELLYIPVSLVVICWIAFYLYAFIQMFALGLCGGSPLLFPIDRIDFATIDYAGLVFFITIPLLVGLLCVYLGLRYKSKPSKKNKNKFVLTLFGLAFLALIVIGWPLIESFYYVYLFPCLHN